MNKTTAPYGSWPSAITSELLTQGVKRLAEPQLHHGNCFWLEARPEDKGRITLVARNKTGNVSDITAQDVSVRTRAHEYGGGSYTADVSHVYFVNDHDQRVYSQNILTGERLVLSPEGDYRFADFCVDHKREQLICVCEIHKPERAPENCIVTLKLDGSSTLGFNMLAFGNDFYSNPRVSPEGDLLSWLTWNHPYMPWDNTECWVAEFSSFGLLQKQLKVAGGSSDGARLESVFQPQWSPNGELFFVSDRNQWWNIYSYNITSKITKPLIEMDAEFATPQWVFGMSTYGFLNSFTIFCTYSQNGQWHAATIDTLTQHFVRQVLPFSDIEGITCDDESDTAVFLAAGHKQLDRLVEWQRGDLKEITLSGELPLSEDEFSAPQAVMFNNSKQQPVHGFYYAPHNPTMCAEENTLPPLIVMCHGGPTSATHAALNLKVQFWTSRGFAVLDVNYSGSTGYGRNYRDRLLENWGLEDVDDICSGARYLIDEGKVDPDKVAVRGSSAGGYSVLAALAFHDIFKAGASLYGIGDLSLLAQDTHKFEARYLDRLIGPWPEDKEKYQARSPLMHVEQLNCPVIFMQGLQDKVVPPNQAAAMVNALVEKSIPVAYVEFPDEAHGFRQAENVQRALESEYAFYCDIFEIKTESTLLPVPFVKAAISLEQ